MQDHVGAYSRCRTRFRNAHTHTPAHTCARPDPQTYTHNDTYTIVVPKPLLQRAWANHTRLERNFEGQPQFVGDYPGKLELTKPEITNQLYPHMSQLGSSCDLSHPCVPTECEQAHVEQVTASSLLPLACSTASAALSTASRAAAVCLIAASVVLACTNTAWSMWADCASLAAASGRSASTIKLAAISNAAWLSADGTCSHMPSVCLSIYASTPLSVGFNAPFWYASMRLLVCFNALFGMLQCAFWYLQCAFRYASMPAFVASRPLLGFSAFMLNCSDIRIQSHAVGTSKQRRR